VFFILVIRRISSVITEGQCDALGQLKSCTCCIAVKITFEFGHHNPGRVPKTRIVGCERHRRESSGVRLGVWGSVVSFHSGARGRVRATSNFFVYTEIKSKLIFGHRCVIIHVRLQRWANRDKSETQAKNRTNGRPGRTDFSGTRR